MKRLLLVITTICSLLLANSSAQTKPLQVTLIKAGRLIDVRAGRVLQNQGILIEGERITAVENDLIDEYVRDEMPETVRRKFEDRFLAS